jgi:23S rRNA pseudouridine2605 synthase
MNNYKKSDKSFGSNKPNSSGRNSSSRSRNDERGGAPKSQGRSGSSSKSGSFSNSFSNVQTKYRTRKNKTTELSPNSIVVKGSVSRTRLSEKPQRDLLSNEPMRLNKVIAEAGLVSRRKADELISAGVVKVNGEVIDILGYKVETDDFITVKGDPLPISEKKIYFLLNKPKDVIVTSHDENNRKTVMDLVKTNLRIFPVGRLDRNTTGALLLTNDGELSHRLLHPSYQIPRTYIVLLDKELSQTDAERISQGVVLEDGKTGPADIIIDPKKPNRIIFTLKEGKNHEVKRIFEHLNYYVRQLDRKIFAGISVQRLQRGDYRLLSKKEIGLLKKLVKLDY